MNSKNQSINNGKQPNKSNKFLAIIASIAIVLIVGIVIAKLSSGAETDSTNVVQGDVIIPISEITETAKFYPVKVGSTNMEVLAVKASDGSIRTAFNTSIASLNS